MSTQTSPPTPAPSRTRITGQRRSLRRGRIGTLLAVLLLMVASLQPADAKKLSGSVSTVDSNGCIWVTNTYTTYIFGIPLWSSDEVVSPNC